MVGAGDTVIHSTDGGFTWALQPPLLGQRHTWFGVSFLNGTLGCVCGNYGAVMCTADGGASWTRQLSSALPSSVTLRSIAVLSGTRTVTVGDGDVVIRTDDAGVTWQASRPPYGMHLQVSQSVELSLAVFK